jgi:hypothetical protein
MLDQAIARPASPAQRQAEPEAALEEEEDEESSEDEGDNGDDGLAERRSVSFTQLNLVSPLDEA